jgi:hypothetical protein
MDQITVTEANYKGDNMGMKLENIEVYPADKNKYATFVLVTKDSVTYECESYEFTEGFVALFREVRATEVRRVKTGRKGWWLFAEDIYEEKTEEVVRLILWCMVPISDVKAIIIKQGEKPSGTDNTVDTNAH